MSRLSYFMGIAFITRRPLVTGGIVVILLFINPFCSDCFCSALLSSEEHCPQRLEGDCIVFQTTIEKTGNYTRDGAKYIDPVLVFIVFCL